MAKAKAKVYWHGKTTCNLCRKDLRNEKWFVDGRLQHGRWGVFCPECWERYGCGRLGVGSGQKYSGGTLEKIER